MDLGIDIGTSAVKVVLVDADDRLIDQESQPLTVSRPQPLWSEQDPEAWWRATEAAIIALRGRQAKAMAAVRGIGLSGQMHGATLLDAAGRVLRPAILWNDGRSGAECVELERRVPDLPRITGNRAMAGFTAPKLLWVKRHEPAIFAKVARVLLPKDHVRLRLTGEAASEMSDSAGTLWLDVAKRRWSPEMLAATDLPVSAMPTLYEGTEATGRLRPEVAAAWGLDPRTIVAGGGGDNAAGGAGIGVVSPGRAFLSLGTSGVYFVATPDYRPNPDRGVHTFCHCLPGTWHQMAVILSAAAGLSWLAKLTGADEATLLAEAQAAPRAAEAPLFLPYLSGERTPHNDPAAKGVFFGLSHASDRAQLTQAVLEGVGFALADGQAALIEAGTRIDTVAVIGGGARSRYWGAMLASILDRTLSYHEGGEVGPAFGAARLSRIAVSGGDPVAVCRPLPVTHTIAPDPAQKAYYQARWPLYRQLYQDLKQRFAGLAG
jgi:xylulokinase